MTIEMLLALEAWISDFQMGSNTKPLYQVVPEVWAQMSNKIIETKKLHAGARNALDEMTPKIRKLSDDYDLAELKLKFKDIVQLYISEKIVYA
jgi:hypothetical protein